MQEVTKENLKIKVIEETKSKGVYSFEPLPTGFGHTLANALRRVLLTTIKGAAITQVKIKGATHQFTSLQGVKEDVVELTMNLKKLRIKAYTDNPVIATIKKKGKGKVTAKDIELSSDAEISNKDLHIATLADDKSSIEMELTIESGYGYSPMESRQTSKVGVIILDALFSPIKNVTYEVEAARFADKVDLDKIVLNIETDGTIAPKEALIEASDNIKGYYERISDWNLEGLAAEREETGSSANENVEDVSIEELPLQTRTVNALKKNGVTNLHQLAKMTNEEIADIKNLGEKSLQEIIKLLEKEGIRN